MQCFLFLVDMLFMYLSCPTTTSFQAICRASFLTATACKQCAKKVVSDSPGLVDFAVGLVFLFLTCPMGKCCFLGKFKLQKDCYQSCQSKGFFGLIEMTCGLLHAIYSLPEWQGVKLTFFAPWQE